MRPQHITAENFPYWEYVAVLDPCFNEAAAYHCGKLLRNVSLAEAGAASMRPQHITAENAGAAPRAREPMRGLQ